MPRRHPDYAALELLAVILGSGAGLTGRIPARIREREGLAYTAYAQTVAGSGLDPGRLVAYVGTSPATVEKAERGVVEEITRLVEDGIEDAELEEARAYLLGREPFRRETARQWADLLIEAEEYGIPLDDFEHRKAELERPRQGHRGGGGPPAYSPGGAAGDGGAAGGEGTRDVRDCRDPQGTSGSLVPEVPAVPWGPLVLSSPERPSPCATAT